MGDFDDQWNHNSHYYELIADRLQGRKTVLDVGCGDGTLARYLASRDPERHVFGIDPDPSILPDDGEQTKFLLGTGENIPLPPASLDAIVAVASLHHMDVDIALPEMRRVIKPGGRIVILGLAKSAPLDLRQAGDVVADLRNKRHKTAWEPSTKKVDPALTWDETREALDDYLPGNNWERLPMWRYLCVWNAPESLTR